MCKMNFSEHIEIISKAFLLHEKIAAKTHQTSLFREAFFCRKREVKKK